MADAMASLDVDTHTATRSDAIAKCDALVVVKRPHAPHIEAARRMGARIVFDPLDWWPSGSTSEWDRDRAVAEFRGYVAKLRPHAVVLPTEAMAADLAFGGPTLVLPHHARPGQRVNPIRDQMQVIGYEGAVHYLGRWRAEMGEYAIRHGLEIRINPKSLADLDVVVALRDGQARGYMSDHWKSGVKLANAMASGTPIVCLREAGYTEIASGGEHWASSFDGLGHAFDNLRPYGERHRMHVLLRAGAHKVALPSLARKYLTWLETLR